jgi:hypothetical protein
LQTKFVFNRYLDEDKIEDEIELESTIEFLAGSFIDAFFETFYNIYRNDGRGLCLKILTLYRKIFTEAKLGLFQSTIDSCEELVKFLTEYEVQILLEKYEGEEFLKILKKSKKYD